MDGISTESQRGVYFDYFVGLLFAQMDGVNMYVKKPTREGEIDVLIECREGPSWLRRTAGNIFPIENKWENKPTAKREITIFHKKAKLISGKSHCIASYFISMYRLSEDAQDAVDRCENPNVISIQKSEILEMVEEGNPISVLHRRFI